MSEGIGFVVGMEIEFDENPRIIVVMASNLVDSIV